MKQIAQLIKADVGLEVAFTDVGGWDTHAGEGGSQGQLSNRLRDYGLAIAAFAKDLGSRMGDVTLVTMSEFGRTVKENGNRGTDHGHANVMLLLGGGVKGGKVYGKWPGLDSSHLYENRDLAVTTDFRDVFAEILEKRMAIARPEARLPRLRPGRGRSASASSPFRSNAGGWWRQPRHPIHPRHSGHQVRARMVRLLLEACDASDVERSSHDPDQDPPGTRPASEHRGRL